MLNIAVNYFPTEFGQRVESYEETTELNPTAADVTGAVNRVGWQSIAAPNHLFSGPCIVALCDAYESSDKSVTSTTADRL